jgi:hypothetical protein
MGTTGIQKALERSLTFTVVIVDATQFACLNRI